MKTNTHPKKAFYAYQEKDIETIFDHLCSAIDQAAKTL